MNSKILVVGSCKAYENVRMPRLILSGLWLNKFGFEYGTQASVAYSTGKITIKRIEIPPVNAIGKKLRSSSGFIRINQHFVNKLITPYLIIKGFWLKNLGFDIGEMVLLGYEYGTISIFALGVQKFSFVNSRNTLNFGENLLTTLSVVDTVKNNAIDKEDTRIRISGEWLSRLGFESGSLFTVEQKHKNMLLECRGTGVETYKNIIGDIRKSDTKLLQVKHQIKHDKNIPFIELTGSWLNKAGFYPQSMILLECNHKTINISIFESKL